MKPNYEVDWSKARIWLLVARVIIASEQLLLLITMLKVTMVKPVSFVLFAIFAFLSREYWLVTQVLRMAVRASISTLLSC